MKHVKKPLSILLSILMVVSMFLVVPITASAEVTSTPVHLYMGDEPYVVPITERGSYTADVTGSAAGVDIEQPYQWPATGMTNAHYVPSSLPTTVTRTTNLWGLVTVMSGYYATSQWTGSGAGTSDAVNSITIPVKLGDRIYSTSFGKTNYGGTSRTGIRITTFDDDTMVNSYSTSQTYNMFVANTDEATGLNYIEITQAWVNAGVNTLNIPCWGEQNNYMEVFLLNAPEESDPSITITPAAVGESTVTVAKDDEDYAIYTVTVDPAVESDTFDLSVGETAKKTLSVTGDFTYSYTNVLPAEVEFVEPYAANTSANDHVATLPETITSSTNLYSLNQPGYYDGTGAWSSSFRSVTFPVHPGDHIYSNSFGAADISGYSARTGIRITYLNDNTRVKSLGPDTGAGTTYDEFSKNGYLTVPEGVNTMNVPYWINSTNNVLYILNAEEDPCIRFTATQAGNSTITVQKNGYDYGVYQLNVTDSIRLAKNTEYSLNANNTGLSWISTNEDVATVATTPYEPNTTSFNFSMIDSSYDRAAVDLSQYGEITSSTNLYTGNRASFAIRSLTQVRTDVPSVTIPVNPGDHIAANSMGKTGSNNGIRIMFLKSNGDTLTMVKNSSPADTYSEFTTYGYMTVPANANTAHIMYWSHNSSNYLYILNADGNPIVTTGEGEGTAAIIGKRGEEVVEQYNVSVIDDPFEDWYTAVVGTPLVIDSGLSVKSVTSSRTNYATVSYSGSTVTVTPVATGNTTITVTYSYGASETFDVYTYNSQAQLDYLNTVFKNKRFSILGDSISTLEPYDSGSSRYYDKAVADNCGSDSGLVNTDGSNNGGIPIYRKDTYWGNIERRFGMTLGYNEAIRGTKVVGSMESNSRTGSLGTNGTPDVIFFYGGTNDHNNANTTASIYEASYRNTLTKLRTNYPDAKIIALQPVTTYSKYNSVAISVCEEMGVEYINLANTSVTSIHPEGDGFAIEVAYILDQMYDNYLNGAASVNGVRYATVQGAINNAGAGDTVKLLKDVTESVIFESGDDVILDLGSYTLTNTAGYDTIFIKKGATVEIIGGEDGTVDNVTHNKGAIINNGELTITSGNLTRSAEYYNSVSDMNTYYVVWNRGDLMIDGGSITSTQGYASLIDNGWNASSFTSTGKFSLVDGSEYLYGYSEATADENPTLEINGGTLTGGHHVVNNDMYGRLTVNGGTLTQDVFSPQVFSTAIYNTGTGAVTEICGGTITCTREDEDIDASYGTSQYFDKVHYFAIFTTNENSEMGDGTFEIKGGTINGRIGNGDDYKEWVAIFRQRPGQPETVVDNAELEVSGGVFDRPVPEQYCADGYIPEALDGGKFGVKEGAYVAQVNDGAKYESVQEAISAAASGDTVKLLTNVTESVIFESGDNVVLDLGSYTLTNKAGYDTIFIKKGADIEIKGEGTVDNVTHNKAAIINNGDLTVTSGKFEKSNAYYTSETDCNNYYTVWNRGNMTINGGTFTAHEGRASLIDNGWNSTSFTSTSKFTLVDGSKYLYGYSDATAYEHPELIINGGTLTGGHHVVNNDMYGHLTVNGGTLTQNLFSPQVFSTAIYNTGTGAVTEINNGTITCVRQDETIPASCGITHFDTVHYFAVFTTNENSTMGDGTFEINGGTINGRIGNGDDYKEWVAIFRQRPGQAEEVEDSAELEVSGGIFDRAVPEQYCADGYIPTALPGGVFGVKEGAYVAQVNDGIKYESVQEAINAAASGDTVKLLTNVTESVIFESGDNVVLDLGSYTLTNTAGYDTIFIKKGATVEIKGSGTVDNLTHNKAAIINNGDLTITSGNFEKSNAYYNSESDYLNYYTIWNRGKIIINGGTFTAHEGRASLIDNGWNSTSFTSTSKFTLVDGSKYLYGHSDATAYEHPELIINGGTLTGGHHVVNNDMYGRLTVNGGTLTQNIFSPQVFSTAIYNTGTGAVTEICGGTITCTRTDEEIPAECGITHFDTVHYFAIFTTNENSLMGDGSFEIKGGTINGRIGNGDDYKEWVAIFRQRPGQAEEIDDFADLDVSGGTFDRPVPEQYCADGYIPAELPGGGYGVKEGTYVAQVNNTKYESVQEAIDAAASGDTVKLLVNTTESVVVKADDKITLDLNGCTLTNIANHHTVVVLTGGELEIKDSGEGGKLTNTQKSYATLFNNGTAAIKSGTLTRENATEEDTYYVIENHGALSISGGVMSNADNCRASLIDNGYASYDSTATYTTGTGDVIHKGYHAGEGAEHPSLTITGGEFYGGRHVINNDIKGVATIDDGYFRSNTSNNATYASKSDVINNTGSITINGGEFECVGNVQYVVANIVNQDEANATPVRINPDANTAKYSDGIMNVTGGTFNGKLYAQLDAENNAGNTADMNVSGGSFSEIVPEEYCADGYIPVTTKDANDMYTVVEGTYVAQVNNTKYESVQEAIDAAGEGDTVKLLVNTTESVVIKADDKITLDLNGCTLTNTANHHTVVVLTGGELEIKDSGEGGKLTNTQKSYATLFNNGTVAIKSGTLTRENATEEDTYYVIENHGALSISGGVMSNADNCRASLIDNGYASYDSTATYTTVTGDVIHKGYHAGEGAEHPSLTITGGEFYGGRHVINNDIKGVATIDDGYFRSNTSNNATYASKSDVINNTGSITINGGEFECVGNVQYVVANIVNQDEANATPVRINPDANTAKYADGIMNITGGTFNGKLYAQLDAENNAGNTADMNVSGGSFSEIVPEEYCAKYYAPVTTKDANDMYTVKMIPKFTVSLTLEDEISINFYVRDLPAGTDAEDYKVWYKVDDADAWTQEICTNTDLNQFVVAKFAAKEMTDKVHIRVYDYDDDLIKTLDYSIQDYCECTIEKSSDVKLKDLCRATLIYGAEAQKFFDYNTDNLATEDYDEDDIDAIDIPAEYKAVSDGTCAGVKRINASLSLESKTELNFYITPNDGFSANDISVSVDDTVIAHDTGEEAKIMLTTLSDGRLLLRITGIVAKELDKTYEITVSAADTTRTVQYSPLSYAFVNRNTPKMGAISRAIYQYFETAKAKLGN